MSWGGAPTTNFSAEWDNTTSANRYMLASTPQNTVDGSHNPTHSSTVHNKLHRQFMYQLGGSGTLRGWVRAFMRAQTRHGTGINEGAQDMISQMIIRVVSSNGSVVRGTALSAYHAPSSAGQTKWDSGAMRNRKFPSVGRWQHPQFGAMLNPVDYQSGDWLVVEVGLRNFTTVTTGGHTHFNDQAASDVPANETNVLNLRSWIEFSPPTPAYDQLLGMCSAGHVSCPWHAESDPVNTATGNYFTSATDLSLPGIGLPFAFTRVYNSLSYVPPASAPASPNLVRNPTSGTATYTASRQYSGSFAPQYGADGITGNTSANNATWAVNGWQSGDWWQVAWSVPQTLDRVVLCDRRAGGYYFGSAGRITFSNGSTVNWTGLPDDCGSGGTAPLHVSFAPKTGITWFRVIGDTGGTGNAGLAEVEAYNDAGAFDDHVRNLPGALGVGWRHAYEAALEISPDGRVTFVSEDGARIAYWPLPGGGYSSPYGAFSTLAAVGGGGYELTRRDQVVYQFDATGRLDALVDRNGNQLTFTYSAGKLTTITDTASRTITLTYTGNRLTSLSGPPSRTVTYTYDNLNRLETVTDTRGEEWTYAYGAEHRLESITDPNQHVVVTNEYGADGRVSAQTDATGNRGTFDWDPVTETSTYTDARSNEWLDRYEAGILVERDDPLGNTTSYAYDGDFNLTAVTDPLSHTTTMTYDAAGNLLTRSAPSPLSYAETWTYTALNEVETYTDGRSNTTEYTYDGDGNLIEVAAPLSAVTTFTRDPGGSGLLTELTDPRNKTTTYSYDADGNLASVTTPLGHETSMEYDSAGRLIESVDARGNAGGANPADYDTILTYDGADHLLTSTDPLGNLTTWAYDPAGNLQSVTDPNSNATSYAYDDANRLTSVTDADNEVTSYSYDDVGNLVTRTDANDHDTTYAYDDANRLTSTTDPLSNVWSLTYDDAGNLETRTDANAKTTTYTWDEINRLTDIDYHDSSTPSVGFAYDANGNRTSMTDGAGSESASFDALNRLTAVTRGSTSFSYGYDAAGNLTSRTYPGESAQAWTYDEDGELASANGATYAYDPAGNLMTADTPDGITAIHSYDAAGRLLEVAHVSGSATLARTTYALDDAGNRLVASTVQGTQYYTYDDLNRLTSVCYHASCAGTLSSASCLECVGSPLSLPAADLTPNGSDLETAWTYDPVGNRLTEETYLGITDYVYDADDRLTSVDPPGASPISYTYDDNGNQTAAGADTFAWDYADRLSSATVGATTETYTYAGDGVRLSADRGGGDETHFVVDRNFGLPQIAVELDASDDVVRRHGYGLGPVSQLTPTDGTLYLHVDGLGSIVAATDPTGDPLAWSSYQPFGELRSYGAGVDLPGLGFTGQYLDEATGLYHLRARQYDPATGRFLATDPVAPPFTSSYVGSYVYVGNNPSGLTDPSGRCPWCVVGAAVGAVGGGIIGAASYVVSKPSDAEWDWGRFALSTGSGAVGGAISGGSLGLGAAVGAAGAAAGTVAWATRATQTIVAVEGSVVGQMIDTSISAIGGDRPGSARFIFDLLVSAAGPIADRFLGAPTADLAGLFADAWERASEK